MMLLLMNGRALTNNVQLLSSAIYEVIGELTNRESVNSIASEYFSYAFYLQSSDKKLAKVA